MEFAAGQDIVAKHLFLRGQQPSILDSAAERPSGENGINEPLSSPQGQPEYAFNHQNGSKWQGQNSAEVLRVLKALQTHTMPEQPNHLAGSEGAAIDKCFVVSAPVVDSGTSVSPRNYCGCQGMCDLNLQLSKSSIYSTKPLRCCLFFISLSDFRSYRLIGLIVL